MKTGEASASGQSFRAAQGEGLKGNDDSKVLLYRQNKKLQDGNLKCAFTP